MVEIDENFYTITGEKIDRTSLVQKMIDCYIKKYPDSQITDFNEGSVIRNHLEAYAVDIYHMEKNDTQLLRACFLPTSWGQYLDLFGEELNAPRNYGSNSWGTVTFSIPDVITDVVYIPAGTVLGSSATGLNYVTSIDCEIGIGETSVDCPAYSQVQGSNTNAVENTITVFRDTIPYTYLTVNNTTPFTGGTDSETDDEYRTRLINIKTSDGFGSKQHYRELGESVIGIHDIAFVEKTGYTAEVIINGDNKPLSDSLLAEVTARFTDETNLVYNQHFYCSKVGYTTVPLEITISVSEEVSESEITNMLTNLFNGGSYNNDIGYMGLFIDEKLSNYQIMTAVELIPGVLQVTGITSNGSSFSDLTPDTNKVLKLGTVTVTQNVVE